MNEWFNESIFSVHHLTNAEGNYLTYSEFKQKYADIKTNFLTYEGIIGAIRKYQERVKIVKKKKKSKKKTQCSGNETKL